MNRKVISAVLIFMMLFSIAAPAFAADFYATVQADSVSGKAGESVTIGLNVTENTGFNMLNITVEYDANKLEFVEEIALENGLEVAANKVADGKVNIIFEFEDEYGNYTEKNAKLLDLSFKIKEDCAPGTYDITLKGLGDEPCMDADLEDVLLTLKSGSVVVEGEPTYAVTVSGGTGTGEYEAGATVAITADVPAGKEFVKWTGNVTFADATAASTTFEMPANAVTVTAEFKDIVIVPEKYNVTVTGGTGSGEYEAGAEVAISATVPEGKVFTGWTGDVTFANADEASTTFVMPANAVTVTANFEDKAYAVTVTGGTGSGEYKAGETVAISATVPEGKVFTGWTGDVTFANADEASTTFVMPANAVTVTANFEDKAYAVTVTGGTGSGEYKAGETVAISATVPEGKVFVNWTGDVTFKDATAAATTFVMPANAVTVTANFEDKVVEPEQPVTYTVVVNGGTGSGEYEAGAEVAISATVPEGKVFAGWTGDVDFADETAASTTFTMPANNVNVTATFEDKTYAVTVNGGNGSGEYKAGAEVAISANVPEGKEFTGWTGDVEFNDATAATTTFVMPANAVTVTANFKDIVTEPEVSSVVLEAGAATGKAGDTVTVSLTVKENTGFNLLTVAAKYDTNALEFVEVNSLVDKNELEFDDNVVDNAVRLWFEEANEVNYTKENVVLAELTFKIKEDCAVGTYAITLEGWNDQLDADGEDVNVTFKNGIVEVVPTLYAVEVVNGEADVTEAKAGDVVTVTAYEAAAGYEFTGWTGNVEFNDATVTKTTFVMPKGNVTVTANYAELVAYTITVEGGSANVAEAVKGTTVTITAKVPEGKEFVNWTGNVTFADANAAKTTFVMPEGAANVKANFKDKVVDATKYAVTVTSGTATPSKAAEGETVTITAAPAPAGKTFDKWLVLKGDVNLANSNAAETTFVMPDMDVEVAAQYKTKSSGGSGGGIGGGGAIVKPAPEADTKQNVIVLTIGENVAKVNGKDVVCDVAPLIKDGRTYTPARFVAEQLGAKVTWDEAKQLVTVTEGDIVIELTIGSTIAKVNGKAVEMDAAAFIRNGRTYTPARFVAEQLGAKVVWDETTRQVTITETIEVK